MLSIYRSFADICLISSINQASKQGGRKTRVYIKSNIIEYNFKELVVVNLQNVEHKQCLCICRILVYIMRKVTVYVDVFTLESGQKLTEKIW